MCTSARPSRWWTLLGAAALAGCAVGPDFVRPPQPSADRYTPAPTAGTTVSGGGQAQRFAESNQLDAEWWKLLRSGKLDALIAAARAGNPDVQAADATLRRSQDALRAGYGVFVPQIDATLAASRQQYSGARLGLAQPQGVFNLFTLGASVSYLLDLWGGQRRSVEALHAQAEAQRFVILGTYLMLEGNVVNAVVAAAAYSEQLRTTEELLAAEREQLRLSEMQYQAGIASYVNVLALKSQIAATAANLPPLAQKLEQAEHLLAVLAGRTPAEWRPPPISLAELSLPQDIPVSLPSQLVRQRPDVLVAEAQLHAANAEIGVATAAMLPNISLDGSLGLSSLTLSSLPKASSLVWAAGAGLAQPLLHGGTLWYQRQEAIDAHAVAEANYQKAVLGAFQQVSDGLRGLAHDAESVAAQDEAVSSAEASQQLVQANYLAGVEDASQLLLANSQVLQARLGAIQARAQRLQDTVALFVALGGGWWNPPPATPK